MNEAEQIAAFIARKGITHVAAGASALNYTDRDWRHANRQPVRAKPINEEDRLIAERHVVVDHLGRERVRNGLGEWIS